MNAGRMSSRTTTSVWLCLVLVAALLPFAPAPARAATLQVPGDHGTIQSAVDAAASGDTIIIEAGTYTENVDLPSKDLTIVGAGVDQTVIESKFSGRPVMRTGVEGFYELSFMTIRGAENTFEVEGSGAGGGIFVEELATVELNNVSVADNTAQQGGGVYVDRFGELAAVETTISENSSVAEGGGIFVDRNGEIALDHSTLSGNSAPGSTGGAVYADGDGGSGGRVELNTSTVSGNSAGASGGVFAAGGSQVFIDSSTIADNAGYGVEASPDSFFQVDRTILAGNTGENGDCSGTFEVTQGHNVVHILDDAYCSGFSGNSITGFPAELGPLQDNGGPTLTHLPANTSPAIDVYSCGETSDQRGIERPQGDACDVGSVEAEVVFVNTPPVASDDFADDPLDIARNTTVLIDVLANDFDDDEDSIFISEFSENVDCTSETCSYDSPGLGVESFDYTISDETDTDTASAFVDVRETFAGEGTATIDGVLSSGEWDGADRFDIQVSDGQTEGFGRVYLMNDDTNLYLALEVSGIGTVDPLIEVRFDEDGDGIFEDTTELIDTLTVGEVFGEGGFVDFFRDEFYAFSIIDEPGSWNLLTDTIGGLGAIDGDGSVGSTDAGTKVFEVSHPLSTGSERDVDLAPGDTVGFQLDASFTAFFGDAPPSATTMVPADGETLYWNITGLTLDGNVVVEDVTANESNLQAGHGVPLAEFPPERLLNGANTIAGAPMAAIGNLEASPMGAIPMAAIPMAAIGGTGALGQTLLSEIPIDGGWEVLLQGTSFEGRPLQSLTLNEVIAPAPPLIGIDPADLADRGLGDLRLGNTGLSDLSIASLMLGDVPLSDLCGSACPPQSALDIETSGGSLASVPLAAIPMAAIPMGAIGDLESAPMGAIPMAAIPLGAIPIGPASGPLAAPMAAIGDLAATPTESLPLAAIPMAAIPMAAIDTFSTDLGLLIGDVTVGSIGDGCITPAGGGTVDCSAPGVDNDTTVDQYLAANGSSDIASSPMAAIPMAAIPMAAIGVAEIPMAAIPMAAIPMAAITTSAPIGYLALGDIPLEDADGDGLTDTVGDLCTVSGAPSPCGEDTTLADYAEGLVAAGLTLADTPMAAIELGELPMAAIPMAAIRTSVAGLEGVNIAGVPMAAIEIDSIDISNSPMGAIPMAAIPAAVLCGDPGTAIDLKEAAAFGALCDDATLGDLGAALDGLVLGDILGYLTLGFLFQILEFDALTYGDVVLAILLAIDFPWEDLPLDEIETRDIACGYDASPRSCTVGAAATRPDITDVDVDFDIDGAVAGELVEISIPSDWAIIPGSAVVVEDLGDGGDGPQVPVGNPTPSDGSLVFSLPLLAEPGSYTLRFAVAPGFEIGSDFTISALSLTDDAGSVPSGALSVSEGLEFGDIASSAEAAASDTLYIGYIRESTDQDWWDITAPPAGSRVAVYLSNLAGDVDTFIYRPASAPLGTDGSERDIPLSVQPFDDDDVDLGGTTSLSPEYLADSAFLDDLGLDPGDAGTSRGTANESADFLSRGDEVGDEYLIQVAGFQGATSESPYVLRVKYREEVPTPMCDARDSVGLSGAGMPAIPADVDTLFLANFDRMADLYSSTEAADVRAELEALASTTVGGVAVNGVVIPIESIPGVPGAFGAWDGNPCDADLANEVVDLIVGFVQQTAVDNPSLRHVAIIGGDEQVPFARLEDEAIVANESTYVEGFENNALYGAHFTRHYLSDAPFGDLDPVPWLDRHAYFRDLGVGRVVETPTDILGAIDAFQSNGGVLDPATAATAGYDFLTDGSLEVQSNLGGLTDIAGSSLINETWSRSDLADTAYGASGGDAADVISPNAHYDHYRSLPAIGNLNQDETDLFEVGEITALGVDDLANRIIFTMGCHGGLQVDDTAGGIVDQPTDWAQVYGAKRAVYIGNTGYGYGDTATVALSEQIMANLAANLGNGQTIGQNLAQAGQEQFGRAGLYGVYDLKAIEEATLYGLPMWRVSVPGADPVESNGSETGPVSTDPMTGLTAAPFSTSPSFTLESSEDGDFYSSDEGTQFMHWRPITPKTGVDATQGGLIATGAILTGLQSRDVPLPDPVFARPLTSDTPNLEPEVEFPDVIFPTTFATLGTYDLLNPDRVGDPTITQQSLNLLAGQYVGPTGTQRLFDQIDGQVYYAPENSDVDWTPPSITDVDADVVGTSVTFSVSASDPDSDVARVVVLYRSSASGGVSDWTALDLIPLGGGDWGGGGGFDPSVGTTPDYIVQVLNGDGVADYASFKGDLYEAVIVPDDPGVNQPPEVGPISFDPGEAVEIGNSIAASATVADEDLSGVTAVWSWGDGTVAEATISGGTATGSHTYDEVGVYRVRLVVSDAEGSVGESSFEFVAVYDPHGGFVTGGGWFDSPAGAYVEDPALTGRGIFAFSARYSFFKDEPRGNTIFKFLRGRLVFRTTDYDWLVISDGNKAQFRGSGRINGRGDYGIMVTTIDAWRTPGVHRDLLRVRIWDKSDGTVVYDNQIGDPGDADPTTPIRFGAIVVHIPVWGWFGPR